MKALCWQGVNELGVETVPDPEIRNAQDLILKVSLSTVCGSDLHLISGYIPFMESGDVIGHEFMGEVVEVGPDVRDHKVGDRVVVCSFISCGRCWYCEQGLTSLCDNSNTNPGITQLMWGADPGGVKQQLRMQTDRPIAVREAIHACRKGGSVFVLGVFSGVVDKFPLGAVMNKGLTLRSAQQHGHRYIPMLLDRIATGELTTTHLATHLMPLDEGARGYDMFKQKEDGCLRAVFQPNP